MEAAFAELKLQLLEVKTAIKEAFIEDFPMIVIFYLLFTSTLLALGIVM